MSTEVDPAPPPQESIAIAKHHIVAACAAALLGCFFLPWVSFMAFKITGMHIAREGGKAAFLWGIPALALLALILSAAKKPYRIAACLAGLGPFIALGWFLNEAGQDALRIVQPTGWLTLVFGLTLIVLCRK
jgi:hypothetical protein